MPAFDFRKTAESLRPHDFEFLVREYVRQTGVRIQASLGDRATATNLTLSLRVELTDRGETSKAQWTVCVGWGDDTRGEVLCDVAAELVRREEWQRTATLRQIEG